MGNALEKVQEYTTNIQFFPRNPMMSHGFFLPMAGLAGLGHLLLISGVVLLIAWAIKHLHGEKLRQAALWCIAGGIVLWVLSFAFGMGMGAGQRTWTMKIGSDDKRIMMEKGMMKDVLEDTENQ